MQQHVHACMRASTACPSVHPLSTTHPGFPSPLQPEYKQLRRWSLLWRRGSVAHAPVQKLAVAYWCFHYAKRIVETFTIHK